MSVFTNLISIKYPDNTNGTNKKCSFICSRETRIIILFLFLGISEQKNDRNHSLIQLYLINE